MLDLVDSTADGPWHEVDAGVSILPQQNWLDGLDRMLYTDWMRNLIE